MPDFLIVAGLSLAAATLVMAATAYAASRLGRVSVVDVAWGLALVLTAVVCAVFSGDWRSWLLVALVGVWGGRLSSHIFTRARGHGEDPRYQELLGGTLRQVGMRRAVRKVFLVQGAAVWLVSLPLQAAALSVSRMDLGRLARPGGLGGRRPLRDRRRRPARGVQA